MIIIDIKRIQYQKKLRKNGSSISTFPLCLFWLSRTKEDSDHGCFAQIGVFSSSNSRIKKALCHDGVPEIPDGLRFFFGLPLLRSFTHLVLWHDFRVRYADRSIFRRL